jgi:hypothetical protein
MTPEEEAYVVAKAYVPEHIVSLMTLISQGDAFLSEDYLGFAKDSWLIIVGYPLGRPFSGESCGRMVEQAVQNHRPEVLWFIGPELPPSLQDGCTERQSDQYYLLDIARTAQKSALLRTAAKAGQGLALERERVFSREHEQLVMEFLSRTDVSPRVRALYLAMPGYVGHSPTAWTLSARDRGGRLCAFVVVELGAATFSAYLLGAHSKLYDAPHASDLLFSEMIKLSQECGKTAINLGLGVHAGIRRFKEKWGGKPALRYEFCERRYATAKSVSRLAALFGGL